MTTSRQRGTYYLNRTVKYYKTLGYRVEKLEVSIPFFIGGRAIFSRKDLLGADLICWKDKEIFIVQVKSAQQPDYVSQRRYEARKEFDKWNVPLPKVIFIWQPRKKPTIEPYNP